MKKALIIAITLLFIPYAVFAEMTILDNSEMNSITGQVGATIAIAAGDLDIEANASSNLSAILGIVDASGDANVAITNGSIGETGQYVNIEFLPGTSDIVSGSTNLIETKIDLSGINIAGGLTDANISLVGLSAAAGSLTGGLSLNRCIVSANIH